MPWMAVLYFQDACIGLFDAILYAIVDDNTQTKALPLLSMVELVIKRAVECTLVLGDKIYDVLKALHPLALGKLLMATEKRFQNQLFQTVISELPLCPLVALCQEIDETIGAC